MDTMDLGRREYGEVWELQKRLVSLRSADAAADTLILVEHDHVITLGRKTSRQNLGEQKIPVYSVERGGDATYHGPGQLVGYPIMKLKDQDVRGHVRALEEVLIRAVEGYGIGAGRKEGHAGVWAGEKKLASVGVAVTNWVAYHGFALNVNTDLSYFRLIMPCGLDPEVMTSMEDLLGERQDFDRVKRDVAREFPAVFARRPEAGG
ncbi:MAG: lipoyl(octanoyl) transferase LipB [Nitrososphaerota archaeon]|nr:lipoyl(octanoyl) transferase LipB [Nitrososphaerota archaeon]MDG6939754.1 lipoyl(octanoyl) transferase LipB [Nitrososphaerota archaeon]